MKPVNIKIRMCENCEDLFPARQHEDDAGYDLRSRVDGILYPLECVAIPTGVQLEIPHGYEAQVRSRSGLAKNHAVCVLNSPGTVDAGFRGEVCAILFNHSTNEFPIHRGDRIAQMVFAKLPDVKLEVVTELSGSSRGDNGFGSTGKE